MTRTLYDAVTVAHIPANATMVAGYANGRYANLPALRARFPHATVVSIATSVDADAQVLDVEKYDAAPDQAPAWCQRQRARGQDPTVYCPASSWPAVRAAFQAAKVPEPHYWIAKYDGVAQVPAGAVAKQYGGNTAGGYDISVVADYWPGVDPSPAPPVVHPQPAPTPTPIPTEDEVTPHAIKFTTGHAGRGQAVFPGDLSKVVSVTFDGDATIPAPTWNKGAGHLNIFGARPDVTVSATVWTV